MTAKSPGSATKWTAVTVTEAGNAEKDWICAEAQESDFGPGELEVPLRYSIGNTKEWEWRRKSLKRDKKVESYCPVGSKRCRDAGKAAQRGKKWRPRSKW